MLSIRSITSAFVIASTLLFGGKAVRSQAQEPIPAPAAPATNSKTNQQPKKAEQQLQVDVVDTLPHRRAYGIAKSYIDAKQYHSAIRTIQEGLLDKGDTVVYLDGKSQRTFNLACDLLKTIPQSFLDKDLGEDGYIGRRAKRVLKDVVDRGRC